MQRAFAEGASITEDAKLRVLEAAAALNYTPNLLARSLATNHTHQVSGFDNFDLCGVPTYGLTTCEQPLKEMVGMVVDMIPGRRAPQTVRLPGKLVVRQST